MPKAKLNIAMIGTGFIAKAHSNAFRQVGHFFNIPYEVVLKVVCGRNQAKLETVAAQWGWEEIATDWKAVVARSDIDIVDIAVPTRCTRRSRLPRPRPERSSFARSL